MTQTHIAAPNYEAMTLEEQEAWKCHREIVYEVPADIAGYRGCIGFGIVLDKVTPDTWLTRPGNKTFLRDADIRWATLTDIPSGYFRLDNRKREVHWATLRRTDRVFGVPALLRGQEGKNAWDFRVIPRTEEDEKLNRISHYPHAMRVDRHPQLTRAFNAIEWAMTSVAFSERKAWNPGRSLFTKAYGGENATDSPLYVFGGDTVRTHCPRVHEWMPQAYIGFAANTDKTMMFDRCVYPLARTAMPPQYSDAFRGAAVDAAADDFFYRAPFKGVVKSLVRETYRGVPAFRIELAGDLGESAVVRFPRETADLRKGEGTSFATGDVIASDRLVKTKPQGWEAATRAEKWLRLKDAGGEHLLATLRCWFDRQMEELVDGFYHWPLALVEPMAVASSAESDLFWQAGEALEYYQEDCDTLVLPPIPIRKWYELEGTLPGAVRYDLHPASEQYETFHESKRRTGAGKASIVLTDPQVETA